jgi:drug/metabolite transporter (DMT)-like permease
MNKELRSHLFLFSAALIYGINYTVAKDVMPHHVKPFGFIFLRVSGATILFWAVSFFFPKEKIKTPDYIRLAFCALFGVSLNQTMFFSGLNLTTPINAAIIMTSNPILVLIAAAVMINEKITANKIAGIILGLSGAVALLLLKPEAEISDTSLGDLLILLNAASYATYLVIVKPLMQKYHPVTIIKWVFLFGLVIVAPFTFSEASEIKWNEIPSEIIYGNILFVIAGTTFLAYLFNIFALRNLSPSVVSAYVYLQPLIATIIALWFGKDTLNWTKTLSALMIFAGVYLVSMNAKKK